MAILPVLRWPDPRLATLCNPVGEITPALHTLAADMLQTMYAAPGRGLAAPQVGAMIRLFVMDATWKEGRFDPIVMLNPKILWASENRKTGPEGCLSIPGITTEISRATDIRIGWTDLGGNRQQADFTGFAAICAQHEYDHLDGIVTLQHLSPEARALAETEFFA